MSLGDFDFEASMQLTPWENYMFWFYWFLTVLVSCIIFLNFLIAEVSSSYEKVMETVDAQVFQQKANLIAEAEDIYLDNMKDEKMLTKYIVIRKIEYLNKKDPKKSWRGK